MSELLPIAEAYRLIDTHISELGSVRLRLQQAIGCLLREDILADQDDPAFDRSAMDGFVVTKETGYKRGQSWELIDEIQPGDRQQVTLNMEQCAKIFTGARVPKNTHVIKKEDVKLENNKVVLCEVDKTNHIRAKASQARQGDLLLKKGHELQAIELSICASVGMTNPLVSKRPRVIHVATGNELVDPNEEPNETQIRDSNSILLEAFLKKSGAQLVQQTRLKDDLEVAMKRCFDLPDFDLILFSGGASVGDYDIGRPLLEKMGFSIHFSRLNLRPGKPTIFGTRGKQAAFVVPGNPVSHVIVYQRLVRRALMCMQGKSTDLEIARATLLLDIPEWLGKRLTFNPAVFSFDGGKGVVRPIMWSHSGDLGALAGMNAMIACDPKKLPKVGEKVMVELL
ncbi:MAG: molybdopterin molybdotransferase MoeA [Verrucomicrobiota bacterium]